MHTSKHLSVISGAPGGANPETPFSLRRDVALALVVVAILLLGAAVDTLSPEQGVVPSGQVEMAARPGAADFVYFPSQYVNQGVEISDSVPQF